jgi:hypothetical protein
MAISIHRLIPNFILGLVFLSLLPGCGYNKLQGLDEDVKGAWAEVQNQYQRRADLVPNLVNTVKGAANFEQETLNTATNLSRSQIPRELFFSIRVAGLLF